jgi:polysaccharide export outer membrane protein
MRIVLLAFFLVLPNCVTAYANQAPPSTQAPSSTSVPTDFVIGLEDILAINVWKEPDLSVKEVMVRPDGKISLPLLGDIQANGLTPMQLQEQITEQMKQFVSSPTVTVVVLKIASRSVSVVGQVAKPGVYYLGSPLTVLELLARAGGFREEANTKKISIVRKENGKTFSYRFNYKDVSNGKNLKQNINLKNGDVVIVP